MEIEDAEPAIQGDRLELLAVVRGLEALDQPSQVTLLTGSSYVNRGLSYGMDDWRSNNWQWESHGKMVPVKNGDLWRRLDRALRVHSVRCKYHRIDNAHQNIKQRPVVAPTPQVAVPAMHNSSQLSAKSDLRRTAPAISRWWRETCSALPLTSGPAWNQPFTSPLARITPHFPYIPAPAARRPPVNRTKSQANGSNFGGHGGANYDWIGFGQGPG